VASNLTQRIITGCIAACVALAATIFHPYSFIALIGVLTFIGAKEWHCFGINIHPQNTSKRLIFYIVFIPYIAPCVAALIWLRLQEIDTVPYVVLSCMASVWVVDIAAYTSGRMIGGPKIAPSISPNKTWAGLIGAMIGLGIFSYVLFPATPLIWLAAMPLAIIAQMGDFFESWLKRKAGLKDSGTLLPGHGGVLDRIDGLITAAPYFALIYALLVLQ
jgi:CDP-diglyceride synthetase